MFGFVVLGVVCWCCVFVDCVGLVVVWWFCFVCDFVGFFGCFVGYFFVVVVCCLWLMFMVVGLVGFDGISVVVWL